MKPLHIGLLVVGAAIAGGLAVKMTQPPNFAPSKPSVVERRKPEVGTWTAAPPAVSQQPVAPVPDSPVTAQNAKPEAPPPVYTEPVYTEHSKPSPMPSAKPEAKPAVKPEPVKVAKNVTPVPPPYVASAPGAAATKSETPKAENTRALKDETLPLVRPPVEIEQIPDPEPRATVPPISARKVTLGAGSAIPSRIIQTLSSDKLKPGDTFQATLADPMVVGDLVIAERGARITGRVVGTSAAGKFEGVSKLELSLSSFETSDGQKIAVSTVPWVKRGDSQRNSEIAKIGGGAALGAIIGAIAGGGKGAAIGAGVGGGAGTGAVALTPSKPVTVPTETIILFRLAAPITITERN